MLIMIKDYYLDSDPYRLPVALSSALPLCGLSQVLVHVEYVHVKYKILRFFPGPVRVY